MSSWSISSLDSFQLSFYADVFQTRERKTCHFGNLYQEPEKKGIVLIDEIYFHLTIRDINFI